MRFPFLPFLLAGLVCSTAAVSSAEPMPGTSNDAEALAVGRAILAVDAALAYRPPPAPTPAEITHAETLVREMVEAGQITRLYPWVNGRLRLEIELTEHILRDTRPSPDRAQELRLRLVWLQRMRLLVDAPH